MRISFLFYLDEYNRKRVRPRIVWGVGGFLAGIAVSMVAGALF